MFSKMSITKSTGSYSDNIRRLKEALDKADAVVIGAGAGLSTSAGFTYTGERFRRYFSDFADKYGFRDMYSGGFYPYSSPEDFGRIGADISSSTAIRTHQSRFTMNYWRLYGTRIIL